MRFGSPRITTVLFTASIGLIFLGTLAQVYHDIWEVVDEYFRAWIIGVELKVLFPPSFFPWAVHTDWESLIVKRFPYPGGALIGLLLVINLTAAHITRFKMKATGARLVIGLVVLAAGVVLTWMVIATGHNRQGLQGEPLLDWSTLWLLIRIGTVVMWLALVAAFVHVWRSQRVAKKLELRLLAASAVATAPLLVWMFVKGQEATFDRIVAADHVPTDPEPGCGHGVVGGLHPAVPQTWRRHAAAWRRGTTDVR